MSRYQKALAEFMADQNEVRRFALGGSAGDFDDSYNDAIDDRDDNDNDRDETLTESQLDTLLDMEEGADIREITGEDFRDNGDELSSIFGDADLGLVFTDFITSLLSIPTPGSLVFAGIADELGNLGLVQPDASALGEVNTLQERIAYRQPDGTISTRNFNITDEDRAGSFSYAVVDDRIAKVYGDPAQLGERFGEDNVLEPIVGINIDDIFDLEEFSDLDDLGGLNEAFDPNEVVDLSEADIVLVNSYPNAIAEGLAQAYMDDTRVIDLPEDLRTAFEELKATAQVPSDDLQAMTAGFSTDELLADINNTTGTLSNRQSLTKSAIEKAKQEREFDTTKAMEAYALVAQDPQNILSNNTLFRNYDPDGLETALDKLSLEDLARFPEAIIAQIADPNTRLMTQAKLDETMIDIYTNRSLDGLADVGLDGEYGSARPYLSEDNARPYLTENVISSEENAQIDAQRDAQLDAQLDADLSSQMDDLSGSSTDSDLGGLADVGLDGEYGTGIEREVTLNIPEVAEIDPYDAEDIDDFPPATNEADNLPATNEDNTELMAGVNELRDLRDLNEEMDDLLGSNDGVLSLNTEPEFQPLREGAGTPSSYVTGATEVYIDLDTLGLLEDAVLNGTITQQELSKLMRAGAVGRFARAPNQTVDSLSPELQEVYKEALDGFINPIEIEREVTLDIPEVAEYIDLDTLGLYDADEIDDFPVVDNDLYDEEDIEDLPLEEIEPDMIVHVGEPLDGTEPIVGGSGGDFDGVDFVDNDLYDEEDIDDFPVVDNDLYDEEDIDDFPVDDEVIDDGSNDDGGDVLDVEPEPEPIEPYVFGPDETYNPFEGQDPFQYDVPSLTSAFNPANLFGSFNLSNPITQNLASRPEDEQYYLPEYLAPIDQLTEEDMLDPEIAALIGQRLNQGATAPSEGNYFDLTPLEQAQMVIDLMNAPPAVEASSDSPG